MSPQLVTPAAGHPVSQWPSHAARVLLNKIQIFGFLRKVSFLPTCLFSVQHLSSTEHPFGLVWAGTCSHLTAPVVWCASTMLSVLLLRTLLLMYLITNNYLWHKNIEGLRNVKKFEKYKCGCWGNFFLSSFVQCDGQHSRRSEEILILVLLDLTNNSPLHYTN